MSYYMDLAKVFDSVPHQGLLLKLKRVGIRGKIFKWVQSFLSSRRQRVVRQNGVRRGQTWSVESPRGLSWVLCCSWFMWMTFLIYVFRRFDLKAVCRRYKFIPRNSWFRRLYSSSRWSKYVFGRNKKGGLRVFFRKQPKTTKKGGEVLFSSKKRGRPMCQVNFDWSLTYWPFLKNKSWFFKFLRKKVVVPIVFFSKKVVAPIFSKEKLFPPHFFVAIKSVPLFSLEKISDSSSPSSSLKSHFLAVSWAAFSNFQILEWFL